MLIVDKKSYITLSMVKFFMDQKLKMITCEWYFPQITHVIIILNGKVIQALRIILLNNFASNPLQASKKVRILRAQVNVDILSICYIQYRKFFSAKLDTFIKRKFPKFCFNSSSLK